MQEVFNIQFKNSIKYGMTYNQFWFDNPQLYYIYEEAYIENFEDRLKEKDIFNWQLAYYIRQGVGSLFDKQFVFPKDAIFFGKKENKPKDVYDMLERFKGMVAEVNKNFN